MASPDPKRQKTTIAQGTLPPKNVNLAIKQLRETLKILKPVNFIYHTANNPYSLPDAFGRIFYQEELVDTTGKVIPANLAKMDKSDFVQILTAKLTYSFIRSQFLQQLFQITQSAAQLLLLENIYTTHYQAFCRLLADHYSFFPTDAYLELHYPQLFSAKPTLNRYPVDLALNQATKKLNQSLIIDKEYLTHNLQAFLEAANQETRPQNLVKLNQEIIEKILTLTEESTLQVNDFNILINKDEFPKIAMQYILPATK